MRVVDPSIDVPDVRRLLSAQYGYHGRDLDFMPVGADSWCFRAGSLWVSVRRDRQGHVPEAYEGATELYEQGCEFVLAPLRGADHQVVHQVGDHPIVVTPFVSGHTLHASTGDSDAVAAIVSKLHAASVAVRLPREDYRFPFQQELEQALSLASADDTSAGPFSGEVQRLIRTNRGYLDSLIEESLRLAEQNRSDIAPFVLTHSEPQWNTLRTNDERLLLFDWGGLELGPPERDWWNFDHPPDEIAVRPDWKRFYELRWILGEVAEYAWRFLHHHTGDSDDQRMLDELRDYFPSRHS